MDFTVACDSSERSMGEDPHLQSVHPVKRGTACSNTWQSISAHCPDCRAHTVMPVASAGIWEIAGRISD